MDGIGEEHVHTVADEVEYRTPGAVYASLKAVEGYGHLMERMNRAMRRDELLCKQMEENTAMRLAFMASGGRLVHNNGRLHHRSALEAFGLVEEE